MDGREVCRLMRRAGVSAPIIMLTAAGTDADTILGLDSGANDYITKPFRLGVLLARMRAQLRQHEQSEDASFAIGPYISVRRRSCWSTRDGQPQGPPHREGDRDPEISLPRRRPGGRAASSCWARSGATTPASPPTRSRRTSIACARRSSATRRKPRSWSPSPAATAWCPELRSRAFESRRQARCLRPRIPS